MGTMWEQLSKEIVENVKRAGPGIVAIDGRSGHTSSGIVWRPDFILTAAHTIRHDASVRVLLEPGVSVPARLAGADRQTDIALLRLDQELQTEPVQFSGDGLRQLGEVTVAVARTRRGHIVVSSGVISGLMGEWRVGRTRIDQFIRPDLTLYPGFSGGALMASDCRIIGLNTSGLLRGKPITIPSSTLLRIAGEIAAKGHVARPYIGLFMQPVHIPQSLQARAGVTVENGLLVVHVESGGPADTGGVLLGDILLDLDGDAFNELDDVQEALGRKSAGQEVLASLIRGGSKLQLRIRIAERPGR
jgi:S1-C subfamily serine protease